jgi:hypothetical protein
MATDTATKWLRVTMVKRKSARKTEVKGRGNAVKGLLTAAGANWVRRYVDPDDDRYACILSEWNDPVAAANPPVPGPALNPPVDLHRGIGPNDWTDEVSTVVYQSV